MKSGYLPMLAKSADGPFSGDEWLFEIKWDGVRAIASVKDELSLKSRNNHELIGRFPELTELLHLAPGTVLDGEIVVMSGGKPDIQSLLPRLHERGKIPSRKNGPPVTYIIFDILEKDGKSLISLPLVERRKILEKSVSEGPHVIRSVPVVAQGEDYYRAAVARGLEGVMAKRMDSPYEPGRRSDTWLKIMRERTCDCVIAGYTQGKGGRGRTFGALVLGLYEKEGSRDLVPEGGRISPPGSSRQAGPWNAGLVYVGNVGTGFSDKTLGELVDVFTPLQTGIPHFVVNGHGENIVWLEPVVVAEVAFQEVTRDRKLRIPRFIRIRSDKRAEDCTTDQLGEVKGDFRLANRVNEDNYDKGGKRISEGMVQHGEAPEKTPQPGVLKRYQEKRDFLKTTEPEGTKTMTGKGNYFVIHEHHARHTHFDLRLERDGVLKSWAVPKGIPEIPGEKHLAVAVEDHPLDYGHFEGTIPAGEYGAGTVRIWDNGTYDTKLWETDKIEITFHGNRLNGHYVLVPFKRAGKNEWLVFKTGT